MMSSLSRPLAMTTNRRFTCDDLLRFNNVNLDVFTETVHRDCGAWTARHWN